MKNKTSIFKKSLIAIILSSPALLFAAKNENPIVKEITPFINKKPQTPKNIEFFDASTYAQLSEDGQTIDLYNISSGEKNETLFDVSHTRETTVPAIDGFIFSPDKSKIIVWNSVTPIYRRSFTARYYVYDRHSRILKPVDNDLGKIKCPLFSPDSRMIAFVFDNNIYLKKLDYNTQIQVTTDGKSGSIINGATDWSYEEEFQTVALMAFSSDNTILCYVKSNESKVPTYTLPIYGGTCEKQEQYELYPGILSYKYPVAGEANSTVSLHAYEISNRNTKDLELPDKTIEYIPRIDALPSNANLLVTTLNRDQNRMEIYSLNPKTTLSTSVFVEKSEAWIPSTMYEKMKIVKDGFIVMSPRSGWTHLYKYAFNGTLSRTITTGEYDVTDIYGTDGTDNVFYQAALPSPIDRTVYRVDVKGAKVALSKEGGDNSAIFSNDCQHAVLTYSTIDNPPVSSIINNKGAQVRLLYDNSSLKGAEANCAKTEFIKVPGANGLEFNAYVVKPANFNPSKRYPVVMYQYSGPGSQTVLNSWRLSWEQYFASKDIIVFCLDGRGTGGRGTSFMYPVYKKLGYYETIDQLAGAAWLKQQTWVDASKIGIFGWSYGGYEALMCLQADKSPFAAGVAVAPVTDWRFYDTIYTERFMLTPQQNFDGYRTSAPLNYTQNMNVPLLLMLGTADDNVHPANTYQYASQLQLDGALFDMMVFPNKNHSIYGCNARAIVYGNMYRFFKNTFSGK